MRWFTTDTEYDGLPLYLRKPAYKNIWRYQKKYTQLLCITHSFDSVKTNGLPTSEYNLSLIDFDGEAVKLFNKRKEGIIFLIETYGGARIYWYYISPEIDPNTKFKKLKGKHPEKKLELEISDDIEWSFIKKYPFKLY